jgi:ArsR family transcriptional regulator
MSDTFKASCTRLIRAPFHIDGRRYLAIRIDICQYAAVMKKRGTMQGCCSVLVEPVGERDAADLSAAFHALADPARLRVLSLIASQPTGEVCACDLVEPIGKSQPTISHHLKVLYEAGLVTKEKRGSWIWYRAVPERLGELRDALAPNPALVG